MICALQRIPGGACLAVNPSVCSCLSKTQLVIKFSNHLSEPLELFPPRAEHLKIFCLTTTTPTIVPTFLYTLTRHTWSEPGWRTLW